jgi:heat-inducible transcriptional repressor
VPANERRYIQEHLKGATAAADELMGTASHLLSELSSQVGIVVTPAMGETVLKAVDFIPVSGRKVLCVVVSSSGFIDNKVIETEEEIPREELVRISNYLSESFAGYTLREIRERLLRLMNEERAQMDRVLARTIELARSGFSISESPGVVVDGTSMLLSKPELSDVQRVRRMFEAFADKARLVRLLSQCLQGGGVRVLIGEDSELTSELGFSVVAAPYGVGERPLGTLGIVGPSRMDYETVIPLVSFLRETLSQALAETFSGSYE